MLAGGACVSTLSAVRRIARELDARVGAGDACGAERHVARLIALRVRSGVLAGAARVEREGARVRAAPFGALVLLEVGKTGDVGARGHRGRQKGNAFYGNRFAAQWNEPSMAREILSSM
jgi:hypothetical protein